MTCCTWCMSHYWWCNGWMINKYISMWSVSFWGSLFKVFTYHFTFHRSVANYQFPCGISYCKRTVHFHYHFCIINFTFFIFFHADASYALTLIQEEGQRGRHLWAQRSWLSSLINKISQTMSGCNSEVYANQLHL